MGLFHRLMCYSALLLFLGRTLGATSEDADPIYKTCVEKCEKTGCIEDQCFNDCNFASNKKKLSEGPWYLQDPFYLQWKEWDCRGDCRYHCMLSREEVRLRTGEKPIKYHGKWPLRRLFGIQEPAAVALSTLNLTLIFHGWVSFFILVYYKLPVRSNGKTYYEYTGLWHLYGILSMNSWFWSAVFHARIKHRFIFTTEMWT
uniref:Post-GPI attachment to proteins factor 3 n=1 Tax=Opuntia streptacantha TaxID=393608 RepID=A0A7C9EUA5_OPUST